MTNLGIYGARDGNPITELKISYQVFTSIPQIRQSTVTTHNIFEGEWYDWSGWTEATQWPVTNLEWVKTRFDIYERYKGENWEYGVYLGMEELFHPAIMAEWFPGTASRNDSLSTWTIDGEWTRYGINVKALRPWYTANKGAWDQSWWDSVKANNTYTDSIIFEWSTYYARQLYEMWHLHMHALGKKSCVSGYIGTTPDVNGASSKYINWDWGQTLHNYIMNNYDSIIAYQYPECVSGCVEGQSNPLTLYPDHTYHTSRDISFSVGAGKILRPICKGKIIWILTAHFPDSAGTSNKTVQLEEYKAMLPYVDVMMLPEFSEMYNENNKNPWPGSAYSPPLLAEFCTATNTCGTATGGTLVISSVPTAAEIFIDGTDQAKKTPQTIINIPAGSHTLKLTLSGYQDYTATFTITSGSTTTLNPTLTKITTTGSLNVSSTPSGAEIFIDGTDKAIKTPQTIPNIPAGSHTLKLTLSGYQDDTINFTINSGSTTYYNSTLKPVVTTTCPTIQLGNRGDAVFALQLKLQQLGYYTGLLDGIFGSYLYYCVRLYQTAKGLTVNGVVDSGTWVSLGITGCSLSGCPVIQIGNSGKNVLTLQTKLKQLGYYTGALDSIYGSSTLHAVILYQVAKSLPVDDIVGTYTWTSLGIMSC